MEIMRSEIDGEITRRSRGLIFKAAALVLTVLMVLGTLPAMNVYADSADLSLDAKGAAVMDVETGKLLWGKNADTRLVPASTTKMMTAFVVLDAVSKGEIGRAHV